MSEDEHYQVGHGRPPLHSRFVKGRSGNPAGAKSRVDRERKELEDALGRTVRIMRKNKLVDVPFDEVVIRRLVEQALQGHLRSIKALFFDHWLEYGVLPISRGASVSPIVTLPAGLSADNARRLLSDVGPPPWTADQIEAAQRADEIVGTDVA